MLYILLEYLVAYANRICNDSVLVGMCIQNIDITSLMIKSSEPLQWSEKGVVSPSCPPPLTPSHFQPFFS